MMAEKNGIVDALDALKRAFDKAADEAGRKTFGDRLRGTDNTELWINYYNAGGQVVAAKNFASRGDNAKVVEKLTALEKKFTATAKAYRAGEKQLPAKTQGEKTILGSFAEAFSRLTATLQGPEAAQQKAAAKAEAATLAEATRLETLAGKISAVRKLGQGA